MIITIIIFILVLSVLVFVHELGHFYTARRCGVKAEEFGLGFPPRLFGWYKNKAGRWRYFFSRRSVESLENDLDENIRLGDGQTVYSLNALPIGGFVKIKGENGEGKDEIDSFGYQKIWRKVVILSAGVVMNVILAWFLLSLGFMIGLPQAVQSPDSQISLSEAQLNISEVSPGSPAERAGLQSGDVILRVDGLSPVSDSSLQEMIAARAGQEVELAISRAGQDLSLTVVPESASAGEGATIGIAFFFSGLAKHGFFPAFWEGAKMTTWLLVEIFRAFGNLFQQLLSGQSVSGEFAGPVGIAAITGQAARLGLAHLLQFAALLSLNLAVLNILPFPALDGGRILFLLIEKIKGSPVKKEFEAVVHNAGFLFLIGLVIFITYKDIIKLF